MRRTRPFNTRLRDLALSSFPLMMPKKQKVVMQERIRQERIRQERIR